MPGTTPPPGFGDSSAAPQPEGGMAAADPVHAQMGDAKIAALEAKVKELEDHVARLTDIAARAQADLQNAKSRMQKDGDDLRRFAAESVIRKLLPVVDNFQRAFSHLPKELAGNDWIKGVQAIEQTLLKELADMGLAKMKVLGEQVDTARHEVLNMGEGKEGEIIEVYEEGYELSGKVIRPAKVKVGSGS